ncbi:hypothetical protein AT05_09760 [Schleiferia thermophila str. Yellowstone]|nr:hypothetical protein AT05_09760 [Schleiferia thermophila str. Yellowstone]
MSSTYAFAHISPTELKSNFWIFTPGAFQGSSAYR